jgi:hypothetical protein
MTRCILLATLLTAPLAAGCFQQVDSGSASGGPVPQNAPSTNGPGLPPEFADADLSQQCPPNSALCFQLCGSPECVLVGDAEVPAFLDTPVISLPEGGTTTDPCVAVTREATAIRSRACAPCHEAPHNVGNFNYVLDDAKLAQSVSGVYMNPATMMKWRMLVPGDPASSWIYDRIATGQMPPDPGSWTQFISPAIAKNLIPPNAEDLSVLYGWILNCAPGADGGAYASSYYGGNYGPSAGDAGAPPADGGGG